MAGVAGARTARCCRCRRRRVDAAVMCLNDECSRGLQLCRLGEPMFLELKHGSRFVKRREPLAKSEVRNVMLEAGVQTADDVLDEIVAGDRRVEVAVGAP